MWKSIRDKRGIKPDKRPAMAVCSSGKIQFNSRFLQREHVEKYPFVDIYYENVSHCLGFIFREEPTRESYRLFGVTFLGNYNEYLAEQGYKQTNQTQLLTKFKLKRKTHYSYHKETTEEGETMYVWQV
jgi:hypothetical protein